jgi:hypothetical protein
MFEIVTYSPGRRLIETYVWLVVSGGTQTNRVIAHRCQNFEENKKKVTGKENQEIHGGVLEDLVENARHTANTGETSSMTFRGIYNDKQGQGVFDEEGIGCWGMDGRWKAERTYRTPAKVQHRPPRCSIDGRCRPDTHRKGGQDIPPLSIFGFVSEACFKEKGRRSYRAATQNRSNRISQKQLARNS